LCETALYRNSILQLLLDLACPKEFPATQNFCKITSIFRQVESGQFKEAWGHSARLPKTTIVNLQETLHPSARESLPASGRSMTAFAIPSEATVIWFAAAFHLFPGGLACIAGPVFRC
jgi:hypothetical protein